MRTSLKSFSVIAALLLFTSANAFAETKETPPPAPWELSVTLVTPAVGNKGPGNYTAITDNSGNAKISASSETTYVRSTTPDDHGVVGSGFTLLLSSSLNADGSVLAKIGY